MMMKKLSILIALCGLLLIAVGVKAGPRLPSESSVHPSLSIGKMRLQAQSVLTNTTWNLLSYGREAKSLLAETEIHLKFSLQDKSVSGFSGCNFYFAPFALTDQRLIIKTPRTTRRSCDEEIMVQEVEYLLALKSVQTYGLEGRHLRLYSAGTPILTFMGPPLSIQKSDSKQLQVTPTATFEVEQERLVPFTPTLQSSSLQTSLETVSTPTPTPDPNAIFSQALWEAQYHLPYVPHPIPLTGGQFMDHTNSISVTMSHYPVFGDLNGDTIMDAAIILATNTSQGDIFHDLVMMFNQEGTPVQGAAYFLGNQIQVTKLLVENGQVGIDYLTHSPQDEICCPTVPINYRFQWVDGFLVDLNGHLALEQLMHGTYHLDYTMYNDFPLTHGQFQAPIVEGAETKVMVSLIAADVSADLNGDGRRDGAAVLRTTVGGKGIFYDLVAVTLQDQRPVHIATQFLGDRIDFHSLAVDRSGLIQVHLVEHDRDDPIGTPSHELLKFYRLQGDQLIEIR